MSNTDPIAVEWNIIEPIVLRVWRMKREAESVQAELARITPELSLDGQLDTASKLFERVREVQGLLAKAGVDWKMCETPQGPDKADETLPGDEWKKD